MSEQIAELLVKEITTGGLAVGEKLPSEADLCVRFGVSRSIIREAVGRLEYDGYLEAKRGSRAQVTRSKSRRAFRIAKTSNMDQAELAQLYEFRAIIEGAAASLAASRGKKEIWNKLEKCIYQMEKENLFSHGKEDSFIDFHQIVAEASGNAFLSEFIVFLNDKISGMMQLDSLQVKKKGLVEKVHKEHISIYEALKTGNKEKAKRLIQDHITNAAERQGAILESIFLSNDYE